MRVGWQRERRVPNFNETVLVETPFMYIVYKVGYYIPIDNSHYPMFSTDKSNSQYILVVLLKFTFSEKATKIDKSNSQHILVVLLKFTFSEKATKIDKIFTVDLTFTTQRQIDGEDFINFCGRLRKHELQRNFTRNLVIILDSSIFCNFHCYIQHLRWHISSKV